MLKDFFCMYLLFISKIYYLANYKYIDKSNSHNLFSSIPSSVSPKLKIRPTDFSPYRNAICHRIASSTNCSTLHSVQSITYTFWVMLTLNSYMSNISVGGRWMKCLRCVCVCLVILKGIYVRYALIQHKFIVTLCTQFPTKEEYIAYRPMHKTLRIHNKSLSMRSSHWNCPKHLNRKAHTTYATYNVIARNVQYTVHTLGDSMYECLQFTWFMLGVCVCSLGKQRTLKKTNMSFKFIYVE